MVFVSCYGVMLVVKIKRHRSKNTAQFHKQCAKEQHRICLLMNINIRVDGLPILQSQPYHSIKNKNKNNKVIMTPMLTETETETTNHVDEHGEVLLTKELNQLSFKDRNDYHGK
jgi:hypothetical protein